MTLTNRLLLVVLLICAGVGLVIAQLWRLSQASTADLIAARQNTHVEFFLSALDLQGKIIEGFVASYSWWDQMVTFVGDPDPAWAASNIDNIVGIPDGGDALWILDADFEPVHSIDADGRRPPLPFRRGTDLRPVTQKQYLFRFFTEINGTLWEIHGAAIQNPDFWRHETPVEGYFLLGKRWDPTWRARLSSLALARLTVRLAGTPVPPDRPREELSRYAFTHDLSGLGGTPVATIIGRFDGADIDQSMLDTRQRFIIAFALFFTAMTAMLAFLFTSVIRPLAKITRSLESRNPTHLLDLIGSKNDFGEIARLLSSQFRQGRMLREEITRQFQSTSPAAVALERESNTNLRLRLASDLHDGPLQSLYAAGLKISGLEARLSAGEAPSATQLQDLRQLLTGCTSDLRNLLLDLEPQDLQDEDLENALQRLERYMLSVSRKKARLHVEDGILDGIDRSQQRHAYYIARELVSNASRHARPQRTDLSFTRQGGFLVIEWSNDGFTPPDPLRPGNGLRNIGIRVQQLDGTWNYRVGRGPAWLVHIELPFSTLTSPSDLDPTLPPSVDSRSPLPPPRP